VAVHSSERRLVVAAEVIVSHDIIIFVETKLDDLDILNVPNGYSYITKNRKKNV
jgi:hypothetical protein